MEDGSVYGGLTRQQEHYLLPAWIRRQHHGSIRSFIQGPNNTGFIITDIHLLPRRHNNGRMQATIQIGENNFSHANLHLIENNNLPQDTQVRIYVGLPNGNTFTGPFL